ncbi:MAG: hypothetical protein ACYC5A_05155 [Thermoleophilia bacterium]
MNFLQEHPRGATVGAIGIGIIVIAALYLLSVVNQPPASAGVTTAVTAGPPGASGQSADARSPALSGDGTSIGPDDYAAALGLGSGQTLEQVIPFDVDSDGASEAVVLVRGEGDGRPLDWYLFDTGGKTPLFEKKGVVQGELAVDGPRLVESEGVYAAEDDACCPSSFKRTYYVWKDGGLVVSSVVAQPAGAPAP